MGLGCTMHGANHIYKCVLYYTCVHVYMAHVTWEHGLWWWWCSVHPQFTYDNVIIYNTYMNVLYIHDNHGACAWCMVVVHVHEPCVVHGGAPSIFVALIWCKTNLEYIRACA